MQLEKFAWAGQAVMTPARCTVSGKRSSGFDCGLSCHVALVHPGFRWLAAFLQPHSPRGAAAHLFFVLCRACDSLLKVPLTRAVEQGRSMALRIGRSACRAAGRSRGSGAWTTRMCVWSSVARQAWSCPGALRLTKPWLPARCLELGHGVHRSQRRLTLCW